MGEKRVGVIGASGWLGSHLCETLIERGWKVTGFSRSERLSDKMEWRIWDGNGPIDLEGLDAVVNLAGESIDQRWTDKLKVEFRRSRVDVTDHLSKAITDSEVKVFLNASAIGIYGDRGEKKLPESTPAGEGYLADLCRDWEEAVQVPDPVRVVLLRTGVVLGKGGGAWARMRPIFKWGIGGRLGNGRQWMPWIHLKDEIGVIVFCLENEVAGPVNLVAPGGVTNAAFTKAVGQAMKRPVIFPAPAFALKLILGDFAKEGLLASTRVVPEVLLEERYQFKYPTISEALVDLVSS